jgi:hypothetical protein
LRVRRGQKSPLFGRRAPAEQEDRIQGDQGQIAVRKYQMFIQKCR